MTRRESAARAPCVLLPGMDGTGTLFGPLARELEAAGCLTHVVRYPTDRVIAFDDYVTLVAAEVRRAGREGPVTLVAESFSGPIAVRVASESPELGRLVLAATFVRPPARRLLSLTAALGAAPFSRPPPRIGVRAMLAGATAAPELVDAARDAIASVSPAVMASRMRILCDIDERAALSRVPAEIRYLRALRDRLVGASHAAEFQRVRPDARVVAVDAPHLILQSAPALCAAAILGADD